MSCKEVKLKEKYAADKQLGHQRDYLEEYDEYLGNGWLHEISRSVSLLVFIDNHQHYILHSWSREKQYLDAIYHISLKLCLIEMLEIGCAEVALEAKFDIFHFESVESLNHHDYGPTHRISQLEEVLVEQQSIFAWLLLLIHEDLVGDPVECHKQEIQIEDQDGNVGWVVET